VLTGIVPEGAEVIDLETLEEQFYAEFDAEQAIPANLAQPTRSTRNLPVVFPWVVIENIKVRDLALKIGKTVELTNGHFLQISKILKNSVTRGIILRGWLLKRTKRMGGVLPLKRNELCSVREVFLDDPRPVLEQSVHEIGMEEVVKTRLLIRTNWPFPAHRAIFQSVSLDKKENEQHSEEHERLVVRWKYITYYDNPQEQAKSPAYQGNIRKRELLPIDEEECTSPQHYLSPDTQRLEWRGDTSLRGAHNARVEGVHRTHRNLRRSQNSTAQKYTYADTCKYLPNPLLDNQLLT
jgi:DNA (cytosine-5)-methyltransferase 1